MRIVAVADTHTFQSDLEVPDGDVFLHAGDLLRGGTLDELESVAAWIRDLPHRHKIVVAGNHDWCFLRETERALEMLGPDVIYLQDSAVEVDGVRFWGAPWQPEFHGWAFNLPRGQALAEKWALIPEDTDVLVTHGPPFGFGDHCGMPQRTGCRELLARIRHIKPKLHMFGHIHQDGGLWWDDGVCICNVTSWECERPPTVIDYDPATHSVAPVMIPPRGR